MSLIFFDGFETYATADILKEWTSQAGSPAINATGGRRGGSTLSCSASGSAVNVIKTLSTAHATVVIGFSFNPSALPGVARSIARLLDAGALQIEIKLNTDGTLAITRNGAILGTTSSAVNTNADQYLELKVTIHDTAGAFELRLNGVNILSATNVDTKNTSNASINQVSLGVDGNPGAIINWKYDDFYILNTAGAMINDFLGDIRIDALYPNADGHYKEWTPNTGTDHYALVDDATPNTSDYNASGTVGQKDSYAMTSPPALTSQVIFAVKTKVAALKDDTGARSIKVGLRSGAVDSVGIAQTLSTSQLYYSHIHEADPATGSAWLPAAVESLEALVETA